MKQEPVVYLAIGTSPDSFLDRLHQVLNGLGLKTLSLDPILDTDAIGIAISRDTFDLRDAEQMIDPDNDPVIHEPEYIGLDLRRFTKEDWSHYRGCEKFPNGDAPIFGEITIQEHTAGPCHIVICGNYDVADHPKNLYEVGILFYDGAGEGKETVITDQTGYLRRTFPTIEAAMSSVKVMRAMTDYDGSNGLDLAFLTLALGFEKAAF
jgi:hypothetical protein